MRLERRCDSCEYWDGKGRDQGRCHRYAPRAQIGMSSRGTVGWPQTDASDWCGEFCGTEEEKRE
jgi:hypothetical protein